MRPLAALALALACIALLPACSRRSPEAAAVEIMQLRLTGKCTAMWSRLSRSARAATTRKDYVARCEEASESRMLSAMFERTTVTHLSTTKSGRNASVVVETDSPDPTEAFNASFRSEVTELGKDVVDILGQGVLPGTETTPPPFRETPEVPRLLDPKSDAWIAEQLSKPGVPRMKKEHTVRLVWERFSWRVDHDPLDQPSP